MTRLGFVLFVCLCVQLNAVSAPFVHLHADVDHDSDHHDGRVVHRHVASHAAHVPDEHADRHTDDDHLTTTEVVERAIEGLTQEPVAAAVGVDGVRVAGVHPDTADLQFLDRLQPPPPRLAAGDAESRDHLRRPPDLSTSSFRGPPR